MRPYLLSVLLFLSTKVFCQEYYLFVGTYTSGSSLGIYVYKFNDANGSAQIVDSIEAKNPSYLTISPNGKYLYSVNENGAAQPGEVSAFNFDKTTGKLTFLNKQLSGGADPCYLSESKNNRWLMIANYSSGTLAAIPINVDGSLGSIAQIIQHEGKSADTARQEKAHVHSTIFSPDEHYLLCADLGTDKEIVYRFNGGAEQPLSEKDSAVLEPGSGPRHLVFETSKSDVYLIEELSGTIDAFHFTNGKLRPFQRISTHPEDFKGHKGSADIHITPDGRFLYATNRGDANSIAIFSIDHSTGRLHLKGIQDVGGKHPRNFAIDPSGRFLLIANRDTDNVAVFAINQQTGLLKNIGIQLHIPSPVCLKFFKE
jgi:6-phosphogluconolactonase